MPKKTTKLTSDDYLKVVWWDKRDNIYIGSSPNFLNNCCHGRDEFEVYRELCGIIQNRIDQYYTDGENFPEPSTNQEFSGRLQLRVAPELHKKLYIKAAMENRSLNEYCNNILNNV